LSCQWLFGRRKYGYKTKSEKKKALIYEKKIWQERKMRIEKTDKNSVSPP